MAATTYRTRNAASLIRLVRAEEFTGADVAAAFLRVVEANNGRGKDTLWGLPLGPIDLYAPLAQAFNAGGVDLSRVKTFNLDEYLDERRQWVDVGQWYSFRGIMQEKFFALLEHNERSIRQGNVHFPDPTNCRAYPDMILGGGGLDICYLGFGLNGHIAFNEPPETAAEIGVEAFAALETRIVRLTPKTIVQNFSGKRAEPFIPSHAVTMGMREILSARTILMRAGSWGTDILKRALLGPVTPLVPGSYLQRHPDCTFMLKEEDLAEVRA